MTILGLSKLEKLIPPPIGLSLAVAGRKSSEAGECQTATEQG